MLLVGSRQSGIGIRRIAPRGIVVGGRVQSYRDLDAWKQAYRLGLLIYDLASGFPADERFGLTSQMRRGAVSVASNIAEGYGRGSRQEYVRFLRIARGALFELETQAMFARDLKYVGDISYVQLSEQIERSAQVLSGLLRSLA